MLARNVTRNAPTPEYEVAQDATEREARAEIRSSEAEAGKGLSHDGLLHAQDPTGGGVSWIVMTIRDRWMSSRSGMPNACNNTGRSRAETSRLASSCFLPRFVTGVRSKFSISPKRLSTDPGKAPVVECSFSFRFNRLRKSCAALFAYNSLQLEESTMIPELTCPFAANGREYPESLSACSMVKPLSCIVPWRPGLACNDRRMVIPHCQERIRLAGSVLLGMRSHVGRTASNHDNRCTR